MNRFTSIALTLSCSLLATAVGACGGGDGDDDSTATPCGRFVIPGGEANPGFAKALDDEDNCILVQAWDDEVAATVDLSCLGTATDDEATSVPITLTTTVTDFVSEL